MADDGFFSRWSRRKLDAKDGRPPEPEPVPPPREAAEAAPVPVAATARADAAAGAAEQPPPPPPPTLEDVKLLTPESDFARFVKPDVAPEVKNAAVRKLFADPRFNVMDGLDVYIDDYSRPDPIPESSLKKLAAAQFLRLFDAPDPTPAPVAPDAAALVREVEDEPVPPDVAQSGTAPEAGVCEVPPDADPDLRLQQDDAPPGEAPRRGAG